MWSLGVGWMTLCTYLIRDWRLAFQIQALPFLITLTYPFFIPESPRWLVSAGRTEEAIESILKIAATNGVKMSEERVRESIALIGREEIKSSHKNVSSMDQTSFFSILQYRRVLVRFAILCILQYV